MPYTQSAEIIYSWDRPNVLDTQQLISDEY